MMPHRVVYTGMSTQDFSIEKLGEGRLEN